MKLPRRQFLHLAAGVIALPALPRIALAENYPSRPIVMVVPLGVGGSTDVIARVVAQGMSQVLAQTRHAPQLAMVIFTSAKPHGM